MGLITYARWLLGSGTSGTLAKFGSGGTSVGNSNITDDGSNVEIGANVTIGTGSTFSGHAGGAGVKYDSPHSYLGDWFGGGLSTAIDVNDTIQTITSTAGTESIAIDGIAHNIVNTAATSVKEVTPLWGTGSDGAKFQINTDGQVTKYGNVTLTNGTLLIGKTATSTLEIGTLSAGAGISITNGAGAITIALDDTNLGTILPVEMGNAVLATATGTVYSSPGTTSGLTATTESTVSFPVPRGGTVRNLYIRTGSTAKVNTPTTVITVRKNAVDTTLTVTMTQTVTTTTSDTTHSFTVVAGDLITLSFITTGAAAVSTSIAGVSFEID